jgi:hypothetical protein
MQSYRGGFTCTLMYDKKRLDIDQRFSENSYHQDFTSSQLISFAEIKA